MSSHEMRQVEIELKRFTSHNFAPPTACRNLDQIRTYVRMLCLKIEDLEKRFNYVPESAYVLLAKYNARQNKVINQKFRQTYC
jgi:hypothetical protein